MSFKTTMVVQQVESYVRLEGGVTADRPYSA